MMTAHACEAAETHHSELAATVPDPEESCGVTSIRYESKLSVPADHLADAVRVIGTHLPRVRGGPGAPPIVTYYFDDEAGTNLRVAQEGPVSFRLRLREYPTVDGRHEYWLEVKRNAGVTSDKRRRAIPAADVTRVLSDPAEAVRLFRSLAPEIRPAPLRPVLVVRYARETFAEDGCRVTVDRSVSFHRPPLALGLPLAHLLTEPALVEPDATVEIKRTAPERAWMTELRTRLTRQPESKFIRGVRALVR